jgi:hypothetical protein
MKQHRMPEMIWVLLDESSPTGTHEFADSVNNGPWGTALTTEPIPKVEAMYRMDAGVSDASCRGIPQEVGQLCGFKLIIRRSSEALGQLRSTPATFIASVRSISTRHTQTCTRRATEHYTRCYVTMASRMPLSAARQT